MDLEIFLDRIHKTNSREVVGIEAVIEDAVIMVVVAAEDVVEAIREEEIEAEEIEEALVIVMVNLISLVNLVRHKVKEEGFKISKILDKEVPADIAAGL